MSNEQQSRVGHEIELENETLRRYFVSEWPCFSHDEMLKKLAVNSTDAAQGSVQGLLSGKVFSILFDGTDLYPAFQFRHGETRPEVGRVLERFGGKLSAWQIAFWFVAENGWLDGKRPVDLLDSQPSAVVEAASREFTETLF
jgi:hypothetical protein